MTNTVKGSAWGFTFIDLGLLLKKILGSKPRPVFYIAHQLIYTKSWFHPVLPHSPHHPKLSWKTAAAEQGGHSTGLPRDYGPK